jgi:hypothetical protein
MIREITALNRRVLIRLEEMSLIITGATGLKRCELPAVWLSEFIAQEGGKLVLDVETDTGHIRITGTDAAHPQQRSGGAHPADRHLTRSGPQRIPSGASGES